MFTSRRPAIAAAALAAVALLGVAGCGKMAETLGQQWVDVTFKSTTSLQTIEHIRLACSHIPNVTADPLPKPHTVINLMSGVRYDTTKASEANIAQLQQCLQKFSAVQGFTPEDTSDTGG
ncbi:MAG TPA: hypothetical protein VFV41_10480 [Streptosporangiaceae bacterium]|nr:hypothetical protein [Streptosporangiaceae bacterium]